MRRRWAVIVVAVTVLLGGLGLAAYRIYLNEVEDSAVQLVPPDAIFYTNVYLNPSTRQKQALRDLLGHFPTVQKPDEAISQLQELFDRILDPIGLTFERDVEPWLGRQVGLYLVAGDDLDDAPPAAVLIATKDAEAAREAVRAAAATQDVELDQRVYEGVEYSTTSSGLAAGVVGDYLVLASGPPQLEASVDALEGESLGESTQFQGATKSLPRDRVALFYLNAEPYLRKAEAARALPRGASEEAASVLGSPGAAVVFLQDDGIVVEASTPGGSDPGSEDVLGRLPADLWAAVGIAGSGDFAHQFLDAAGPLGSIAAGVALRNATGLDLEDELLSWMGDLGFYVRGEAGESQPVLVVESTDPGVSKEALVKIQIALIRRGVHVDRLRLEGFDGFSVEQPGLPSVHVAAGNRVVLAGSREAVEGEVRDRRTLAGDAEYSAARRALGRAFSPRGFLRVSGLLDEVGAALEESAPELSSSFEEEAKQGLSPFSFIIYGSRRDGDRTASRLMIGVE